MLNIVRRVLASPWAGVFSGISSFILLFMLAAIAGEHDPLQLALSKVFPDKDSFVSAALELSPLGSPPAARRDWRDDLLLIRHSNRGVVTVKILQDDRQHRPSWVSAGSIGRQALFRPSSTVGTQSTVLLEAEMSPSDLVAMMSESQIPIGESLRYRYFSNNVVANFSTTPHEDLLYTKNELKSLRITYTIFIIGAFFIGLSLNRFRTLEQADDSDRAAD
ncbi:MAG: hypothetical protein WAM82_28835 [Thermoanaerobaculia bacterium]